ncbi:MAG TPA: bifunctional UDP-N-acetylglucosamine diphosphorylase/glucosamine-1-phosphate N-acetyltransferase GlmU, partial [Nitrospiria bacterium]|nr:bifunctional UDP-N-acetylglucosamine diphosphorylase/glucosamine-1-phosphate N-acetyltransferase GlmU [Nitrospiria bacterium]
MSGAKAGVAVVVMAAGQGKRMKSALPKVLHPVGGRPMVEYALRAADALAPAHVVVVVGHGGDAVAEWVGTRALIARQDPPRGTGDAVRCALSRIPGFSGTVAVLSGDTPLVRAETVQRMVARHRESGAAVTLATMRIEHPTGYGRVLAGPDGRVTGVVEERDATTDQRAIRDVNAGLYALDAAFLRGALESLKPDNAQGEYYLPDVIGLAVEAGLAVRGEAVDPEEVLGVNTRAELARVEAVMRERIRRRWMAEGVTLLDPARIWIDDAVAIGPDTVIAPGAWLEGETVVGSGCRIGPSSHLTDSRLGDRVTVKDGCVIDDAVIEDGASVGPFAHLRPGTILRRDARVGNFVELKKADLGAGSKANHLSYLGDAVIGADVNIGAGTITCNYDGVKKSKTVIEDGVFIGSDSQLVAPVTVGKGAIVAAGTTVTQDVPPDALVIGRVRQTVKTGWVKTRVA